MPFTGNTYALPEGSLVNNGDTTNESQHNTPLLDIGAALTSLSGSLSSVGGSANTHAARTDNPHGVTKAQVGLGAVENVPAANLRDRGTHTGTQSADTVVNGIANRVFTANEQGKLANYPDIQATVTSFPFDSDLGFSGPGTGGPFTDFDCTTSLLLRTISNDNLLNSGENGALRSAASIQMIDQDNTDYVPSNRQVVSYAMRLQSTGNFNGTNFDVQSKDIVGLSIYAAAAQTGDRPLREGVSGINIDSEQWHEGISTNEFIAGQPIGSTGHAAALAPAQAVVRPYFANADATHQAWGVLVSNDQGFRATAAIEAFSAPHGTIPERDGSFVDGVKLSGLNVTGAALVMPRTGGGAGLIDYGPNTFSNCIASIGRYDWLSNGSFAMSVNADGLAIGTFASGGTALSLPASTGARSVMRIPNGAVPAFRQDGDIYRIGQQLFLQDGATLRSITFV